tara:strand:+ start:4739 stop:5707 length:969 start_codon:yes stop_codon:yes gene_type:complete
MTKPYKLYLSDKDNAETLALIAGSNEGMYRWQPYLKQLQKHFNVFVVDNPGIGLAPVETVYTIEELAERYHSYLEDCGVTSYHLLGQSLGGFIAQAMAHKQPNAVKKLVLVSTSVGSFNQKGIIDFSIDLPTANKKALFGEDFSNKQLAAMLKNDQEHLNKITLKSKFASAMASTKFTSVDYVQDIKQQTLLIHGKQDNFLVYDNSIQLASLLDNAKMISLEKVGHLPIVEKPELWNSIIDFFNGKDIGEEVNKTFKLTPELIKYNKNFKHNVNLKKFKNVLAMTLAGFGTKEKRLEKFEEFLTKEPKESLIKRITNKLFKR